MMKKVLYSVLANMVCFVAVCQEWSGVAIPANAGSGKEWQLQTAPSDDFNYTFNATNQLSNFGNNKWYNFYHNSWNGPGSTYWQYNHTAVDGDNLVIRASRNPSTSKMGVPGINSGCITSNNKVKYPVFIEAAVSVANISLASDVWLLSPDDTQEIDMIECYGGADNGNAFFAKDIHLSHHSFVRNPFQDYQPRGHNSWWTRSDITTSWGDYCWNNDNRKYVRIGVNWIGPKHFEYYVDGELVRVLYDKACATKNGNTWYYTYPSMTNGQLDFDSDGYQTENAFATSANYTFATLQNASNTSSVSVIDPYNFQGGVGFTKELDIIINVESQDWHVAAGRTPGDAELNDATKNQMKVDWIRVYKPVATGDTGGGSTGGGTSTGGAEIIIEAESFGSTGGTYNDSLVPYGFNNAGTIVNYVNTGDWAEYAINATEAGEFEIKYSIATPSDNAQVRIKVDGQTVSTDNVPNNGSWGGFATLSGSQNVSLTAGSHTVRIEASGTNAWQWNLDKVILTKVISSGGGTGSDVSVVVQAENFTTTGGTYNDALSGGPGLGANTSGTIINFVNGGDYMDYVVSIPEAGAYEVVYNYATPLSGTSVDIAVSGTYYFSTNFVSTGGWGTYQSQSATQTANFTVGNHTIRLTAGAADWQWNLDHITLTRVGNQSSRTRTEVDEKLSSESIVAYPVPASTQVRFAGLTEEAYQVSVYDMRGKKVVRGMVHASEDYVMDVRHLEAGIYVTRLYAQGQIQTMKINVRR
ncbi:carbohydrate-binding protein [Reichenbachiella agarivorans]|uniref:Carbohydrate-binding protein n=1 Tax=Reichenbachiella agarivorans TaxID=2979464 RepID=A0ABY6CKH0_9BACT|nr:carbohydrate-binding protein [Reichenbachiella agarivorans]UXP31008.1 carbohydrate-binding protein [Reichenbachiella agarivorans]